MALWPRMRIPLWVAVAVPAAAYIVRSLIRGSMRPDMPQDAIVLGALVIVLVVAARYGSAAQGRYGDLDNEARERNDEEGDGGQDEDI